MQIPGAETSEWLIPAASALVGAVVGGGGATAVARLALTESLRKVFADKEDVITPAAHAREMNDMTEKLSEKLRHQLQSPFIETAGRIEREHVALRSDLERAIGALDQANRSLREEGKNSAEAVRLAAIAQKEVEGLTELYKQLSIRMGYMQDTLEGVKRVATAVDELKQQVDDLLNYQIAEERRRGRGGGQTA
jgi:hypothetical protein